MTENSESVKVVVRCRPMNKNEIDSKSSTIFFSRPEIAQCTLQCEKKSKTFTFDRVYGNDDVTSKIYDDIAYPLVEGVTEGYNGTIFAYGQTGCGKSYSMQGVVHPKSQIGIIPRAFTQIFNKINISGNIKYLITISYLEIYNEIIYDLFGKNKNSKLELKEHPEYGVYVQDLSMHTCSSIDECQILIEKGWRNRATGSTQMNKCSSRSHAIFTMKLDRIEVDQNEKDHIRQGKLNLVDLAGSERQSKSGAIGERLKEATKINLSLSALGNVISSLVDPKCKHVPYRDAKLTRLLQDSLGGNTKTLMIACVSPADVNYGETLSTLRYANRAKNIKNKPVINEDPKDTLLREYKMEIERLRELLSNHSQIENITKIKISDSNQPITPMQSNTFLKDDNLNEQLEDQIKLIKNEYEQKLSAIKDDYNHMKYSKERLQDEIQRLNRSYNTKISKVKNSSKVISDDNNSFKTISESEVTEFDSQQALQRLTELEEKLIGGEKANDQDAILQHKKKLTYAEQKQQQIIDALNSIEGEEMMVNIIDNLQNELREKVKQLQRANDLNVNVEENFTNFKEKTKISFKKLMEEYKASEKNEQLLNQIIEKIQPCLRPDSNYFEIDKIKQFCKYDSSKKMWILPNVKIIKTVLPDETVNLNVSSKFANYVCDDDTDNYLNRTLNSKSKASVNIFKSRQDDLLNKYTTLNDKNQHGIKNMLNKPKKIRSMTGRRMNKDFVI